MAPRNLNEAWASVLISTLVAHGVKHAVVCPGSRSTPLALACARASGLRAWSVVDERSAGFFALGLAKGARAPVVLVCTSGTAGAHFYPAVIEAHLTHVPLVILTADRPPELHGCGALQSIDQQRLFGVYAAFVDVGTPGWSTAEVQQLRATATRAATGTGVFHLNCPLREPLAPIPEDMSRLDPAALTLEMGLATPPPHASADGIALELVSTLLRQATRPLIIVGPHDHDNLAGALGRLAEHLDIAVVAEGSSNVRWHPDARRTVSHADALLRYGAAAQALHPDVVLKLGGPLTTRGMQTWLDRCGARVILIHGHGDVFDHNHTAAMLLHGEEKDVCAQLVERLARVQGRLFTRRWLEADRRTAAAISATMAATAGLTEPLAAHTVLRALPDGTNLFISSSMPIRDVEAVCTGDSRRIRTVVNRGAAGIDGIASTALGVAAASGKPTLLLTGDLSFIHDLGGLLSAKRHRIPLTIVVVNNDGGGIFGFLPVAQFQESFEEFFSTPHGLDLSHAAALFGAAWHQPKDAASLGSTVALALQGGFHLVEARTQRADNKASHDVIWTTVTTALKDMPW